jgi:hypothetical protein
MAKAISKDQEALCAYIKECRDQFRRKGVLHSAFARLLGISPRYLITICNGGSGTSNCVPSTSTLQGYVDKLEKLLEYHDIENNDDTPILFI